MQFRAYLFLTPLLLSCSVTSLDIRMNYDKAVKECFLVSPEETKGLLCLKEDEPLLPTQENGSFLFALYHDKDMTFEAGASLQLEEELWLISQGELASFAKGYEEDQELPFAKRLQYKLGLHCDAKPVSITIFALHKEDVFRPAYASDPTAQVRYVTDKLMKEKESPEHVAWFEQTLLDQYFNDDPLPWTRLGYSYDYYFPAKTYGFTQFVARIGSIAEVISTQSVNDYYSPFFEAKKSAS